MFGGDIRKLLFSDVSINSGGRNWLSVWVEQVPTTGNGLRRPAAAQPGNDEVPFFRAGLQCTVYSLSGAVNSEICRGGFWGWRRMGLGCSFA